MAVTSPSRTAVTRGARTVRRSLRPAASTLLDDRGDAFRSEREVPDPHADGVGQRVGEGGGDRATRDLAHPERRIVRPGGGGGVGPGGLAGGGGGGGRRRPRG